MPAKSRRVFLVEGRDDREVVFQICNYHQVDNRDLFDVESKNGYESLRDDLKVRPLTGVTIIGAIVDADVDPRGRWDSLRNALHEAGYQNVPHEPSEGGTIIPGIGPLPSVGIWLMPNNRLAGLLEDFLALLIRQDDVLLERAGLCIDSIPTEHRKFTENDRSKALIHTWLAWQEEPGSPLGLAITRHYLNGNHAVVTQFLGG